MVGDLDQGSGIRDQGPGIRKQETGDRKQETGNMGLPTFEWVVRDRCLHSSAIFDAEVAEASRRTQRFSGWRG
jgi:hypothetical protein